MLRAFPSSRTVSFLAALCGTVLIGGFPGALPSTFARPAEQPAVETIQQEVPSQDSSAEVPAQQPSPSPPEEESASETLLEIVILGPILLLLLSLLLAFPTVLLAVSLVMDGGCLRYICFGVGWIFTIFYGLLTGALVAEEILGLGFLTKPIFYVFMWGYPVAAYWGHKKLQAMPEEQYRAWDQTLTGGALLGFGAGSIAGLLRSAASGFGGFGGGSFGGGGAGGSWSGASGAAGGMSSTAAGSASVASGGASSAAAGTSTSAVGGATGAAIVGVEEAAHASTANASANTSDPPRLWARLKRWFQKFRWYHGFAFVLVTLVFVPLGLGTMQALQNTKFLVFVLVCVALYSGYKLFRRHPEASQSALNTISSFRGGEASSSWS